MAKVGTLQINGAALTIGPMVKRKTPSELRGEQLKRSNTVVEIVDKSPAAAPFLSSSNNNASEGDNNVVKKLEVPRFPRYIDTRMDEVFPAKKCRLRLLSMKENAKENISTEQFSCLKNLPVLSNLASKRHQISGPKDTVPPAEVSNNGIMQSSQTVQRCSPSIFRSVTDLSSSGNRSSDAIVDMDKALKGLYATGPVAKSGITSGEFGNTVSTYSGNFCSECNIPGQNVPLDFTLKTKMRVASSCSVKWIHRAIMCSTYNGMPQFTSQFDDSCTPGQALTSQVLSFKALHSWVYPQSMLPSSVISMFSSSTADGDFLRQRQLAWEGSFRSLYYMLRKKACDVFYVCTSHFVVMFISGDGSEKTKESCNAYISQSTRSLRSLLREHNLRCFVWPSMDIFLKETLLVMGIFRGLTANDEIAEDSIALFSMNMDVCFSMPLSHSKVEQVATEDLVELSQIEMQNLGQIRRRNSLSDDDNSPQSLLAFCGNKNVHGLYDFLLNYRSSLTVLSGVDVPALYSPVPFQNAAIVAPEIRCVDIKRTDHISTSTIGSTLKDGESDQDSSTTHRSRIEIKAPYIPSWIICRVCALISSDGKSFETSFMTERTSIGLNVALGTLCEKPESDAAVGDEDLQKRKDVFGIPGAVILFAAALYSAHYINYHSKYVMELG